MGAPVSWSRWSLSSQRNGEAPRLRNTARSRSPSTTMSRGASPAITGVISSRGALSASGAGSPGAAGAPRGAGRAGVARGRGGDAGSPASTPSRGGAGGTTRLWYASSTSRDSRKASRTLRSMSGSGMCARGRSVGIPGNVRAVPTRCGNLVEPAAAERLAANQPPRREPPAPDRSVPRDRLGGVGGARGNEPAVPPQYLGKRHLIGPNRAQQQARGQGPGPAPARAGAGGATAHAAGAWHDSRTPAR